MVESIKRLARLKPTKIRKRRIKWNKILLWDINKRYTHSWYKWVNKKYWNFYWYVKKSFEIMSYLKKSCNISNKVKKQMSRYNNNYEKVLKDKEIK
jgi:hypothetical protein